MAAVDTPPPPPPLLDLLSNEYLLLSTTPYLLPHELHALSLTSRSFRSLLTHSRSVWRHLHRPPPALLSKLHVVRDLKTLILDTSPVTVEDLHGLLAAPYRIQILSIRDCLALNQHQLMLLLQYLVRPGRSADATTLKGVYLFGSADDDGAIGRFVSRKGGGSSADAGWPGILMACEGTIVFDSTLCGGCGGAAVATTRLAAGCGGCGAGKDELRDGAVLVPPAPLTTSDVRVACRGGTAAVLRCSGCLERRSCEKCGAWWCEQCVEVDGKRRVNLDCYECGVVCESCGEQTGRVCRACKGGYCVEHNDGADNVQCEWCNASERRTREFHKNTVNILPSAHRTLHSLAAVRSTVTHSRHFREEVIVRNRCLMTS